MTEAVQLIAKIVISAVNKMINKMTIDSMAIKNPAEWNRIEKNPNKIQQGPGDMENQDIPRVLVPELLLVILRLH